MLNPLHTTVAVALQKYRATEQEQAREASLVAMIGSGDSVLDIGAKEGHYASLLRSRYNRVVALDLQKPEIPDVECVAGDACNLHQFADGEFGTVVAAEVLEHIPDVTAAAGEIARVARDRVVIGVPYKQDIRLGRATCQQCGLRTPPYGHVHSFDKERLCRLFSGLQPVEFDYVGSTSERTSMLAMHLMDFAGNPWGCRSVVEPCADCGALYVQPRHRSVLQRAASRIATRMNSVQTRVSKPHAQWIHAAFQRT